MKELLIAIAVYLSVGYINEFTAENQVYHDIKNPPLFDRGHQLFPTIDQKYPNCTNFILCTSMGCAISSYGH